MFKLWAKQYDGNHKIIKNDTFEFRQDFDAKYLSAYLQVVCNEWKTETPIVLSNHIVYFDNFNHVKFTKSDFIDSVDFNYMTIQIIS